MLPFAPDPSKPYPMFNLFKKKSELEKLQEKYEKLLKESYELSHTNREASDLKRVEAEAVGDQIDLLKKKQQGQ